MPQRVLLVDDDIVEISMVKRVLQRVGLPTTLATNSTDALSTIEESAPDLVVLAPACENGDGAVLARDLAAHEATRRIPLILLGEEVVDGIAAELVARPIDSAALERAIRAALQRSGRSTATPTPTPTPTSARSPVASPPWSDAQRSRYESQVAELERAAAEQEAVRELRRVEHVVREVEDGPPALHVPPSPREETRSQQVAESTRQRLLAMARERAVAADSRLGVPEEPDALPSDVREGSLAAVSMARWLALAAPAGATGRLRVEGEPARSLWLELGRVVGADSSEPSERAEEIALRLGLLTRDQHREVLPSVTGLGSRRVGALLHDRGFLKTSELALLARRHAEEIAFALFTTDARYRFEPGEAVPAEERLTLDRGTVALAVEGVRRRWGSTRVAAALGGPATLLAPRVDPPPVVDLGLCAEERTIAQLADGLHTVDEILAGTPLDALSSRQILAALVEVGVLEVKIRTPPETAEPPLAAGSIDMLRFREKLEQVRRADYFVILGLGRSCTGYEVREASERLLSELSPDRFAAAPELAGDLEEIRRVLREARDVLSDDGLRAEYVASLEE